ncbi:MAG: hypothetical protein M3Y68_03835 [Chloroflexota bacterium]|nr:hypothetical protein [Chloroflexota bacterium]
MRKTLRLWILLAWLIAACSPAATSTPEQVPDPTQEPEPTTSPVPPTESPAMTEAAVTSVFQFAEGNPVLPHRTRPNWDSQYIDPGGMVYHEGQFHMFYNGISRFPAPVGVGYATSVDGYEWTRQAEEPVLSAEAMSGGNLSGNNLFVTSALVEPDGTWVLYFYTLGSAGFTGSGEIGRATAPAPTGPWTIDPEPMLSPGPSGSWDDVQVSGPNVLKSGDTYFMYYDGSRSGSQSRIGLATSSDGIHWEKYNDPATEEQVFTESDPVLGVSDQGWDSKRVIDPNVIETSDGFEMIYMATTGTGKFAPGDFAFGLATSPDGIQWTKSKMNPLLTNKDYSWWKQAYLASLLHIDGTYYLYFDAVASGSGGTDAYLATYTGLLK